MRLMIEVYLAMGEEQAEREHRAVCLEPPLPDSSRIYLDEMDRIPEKLCISKTSGWEKEVCIKKEDIAQVLSIWYPNGIDDGNWRELVEKIEGDHVWIIGFGD